MLNKWHETDELQWCKPCGNRLYCFIQALWIDECASDPEHDYCVLSGIVDLDNYTEEETEFIISGYYEGGYNSMLNIYGVPEEDAQELDSIVAECIFEQECLIDGHSHGTFTKDGAIAYIEKWIKEN